MMIKYLRQANSKHLIGTALLRLDFNTEDEWRMEATLPTLRFLQKHASKIVIISHRGRPTFVKTTAGTPEGNNQKLSLSKNAKNLEKLLKKKVFFIPHFRFSEIKKEVQESPRGSIFLLENLRFLKGEEKDNSVLAEQFTSLADYYVNDAFAVSHRKNASVDVITEFLPSYGGLELESEVRHLSRVMKHTQRPLMIIFGGGKAHDKLPIIKYLRRKADTFILGGAVANAILHERGIDIKNSTTDEDPGWIVKEISKYTNIVLPIDFVWDKEKIFDSGPKSAKLFAQKIKLARTIIWNGPFGFIEKKKFSHGTTALIQAISRNKKAFCLAGGGETVMFIKENKLEQAFNFVSTGGGAMLAYLAGEKLPGVEALKRPWPKEK